MTVTGVSRRRLAKTGELIRVHSHLHPDWAATIDRAAELKGVSRSHFIALAALAEAQAVLKKKPKRSRTAAA